MDKIFLYRKHAKTSENCNKLSKSVSYETLVGGTPTTCTAHKQTQCLSKGSADYRFCKTMRFSYENLVDRLLQTSPVFRLVKVLTLAAVLSMGMLSESWADTEINCLAEQQSCGTNCCWSYSPETKKLSITGGADGSVGTMDDYSSTGVDSTYKTNTPWDDYRTQMESVDIKGVENVGRGAFRNFTKIQNVNMDENISSIESDAFWNCRIKNLQFPDSIKTIGDGAFSWNANSELFIPDMLENIGIQKYGNYNKLHIICRGNKNTCLKIQENLNIVGEYEFSLAKKEQCTGSNYYWSGTNCNNKKNGIRCASAYAFDDENNCIICNKQGYRNVAGYCNRVRYTPAEAAEVLKDTDNEIIMTFKVNR